MSESKRTIERDCVECGKTVQITVYEDGTYEGGHYFGDWTEPDEESEGEFEKTGEWEGFDVVKWTGKEVSYEYWLCEDCYADDEEGLLSEEEAEDAKEAVDRLRGGDRDRLDAARSAFENENADE